MNKMSGDVGAIVVYGGWVGAAGGLVASSDLLRSVAGLVVGGVLCLLACVCVPFVAWSCAFLRGDAHCLGVLFAYFERMVCMRTLRTFFLVCIAVMAFGAVGASSASAIEWLVETASNRGQLTMTSASDSWTDESTKQKMECFKSSWEATINEGLTGADIGKITMATWNKGLEECELTGSIKFNFKVNALSLTKPWLVLAIAHENGEDLIWMLFHVGITHISSSFGCDYLISGPLIGLYHQSSLLLLFGPTVSSEGASKQGLASGLKVSNSSGCLGAINNGDQYAYESEYKAAEHVIIKLGP